MVRTMRYFYRLNWDTKNKSIKNTIEKTMTYSCFLLSMRRLLGTISIFPNHNLLFLLNYFLGEGIDFLGEGIEVYSLFCFLVL